MDGINLYKKGKKNLILDTDDKNKNILKEGNNRGIISNEIIDNEKNLDKKLLINKQTVKTNLKAEDAEVFGNVVDVDLHKYDVINFENLPHQRLRMEREAMNHVPHFKGCKKYYLKAKWKHKQQKRIDKAEKLVKEHNKLLKKFADYKAEEDRNVGDISNMATSMVLEENHQQFIDNKPQISSSQMLDRINQKLTYRVLGDLQVASGDKTFASQMETFFSNYDIDGQKEEEERLKAQEKDKKKKKKKADKNGQEADDNNIIIERQNLENELTEGKKGKISVLDSRLEAIESQDTVELKDMAKLFSKVLKDSQKPYTENKHEKYTTRVKEKIKVDGVEQEVERDVESNLVTGVTDLGAQRYEETITDAKKVLAYAKTLNINVPPEIYCLIEMEDNNFLKNDKLKFDPAAHAGEAYVLLASATAKVFYEALNRFAGYKARTEGKELRFTKDTERLARNYDVFNVEMMTQVRNIRDKAAAYATEIRKNRLLSGDLNTSEEVKQDRNLRDNVALLQGMQPTGMVQEEKKEDKKEEKKKDKKAEQEKLEKEKLEEERKQEKIYEEWKRYLTKDIRGTEEVDQKDMKKEEWVLKDYADKVFELMKNTRDCRNLTGEPLKKYLVALNTNLRHNLKQLEDELPKTSVGSKFLYIPKMKEDFINMVKEQKFGMLLCPDNFFRNLLKDNAFLDDFFDRPKYKAAANRQREIMKSINTALGTELFTNAIHLSGLWANETIQKLLMSEPLDKAEQEKLAEEEYKKGQKKDDKQDNKPAEDDGLIKIAVNKALSKSNTYGVTDKAFQESLTKIRATVHDNVAVVDRKLDLMGVCSTAKDMLKRNILLDLGGEFLLGYTIITQDIVEYTVENMMALDGDAAGIQRAWDRKFAGTGLPKRLSNKIEKLVAAKINSANRRDEYYLRPQPYWAGKEAQDKWEDTDKKTNNIMKSLKLIHSKHMSGFLKKYAESDELKNNIKNPGNLLVNKEVRFTKEQWDKIDMFFEDYWLEVFEKTYTEGKYNEKEVNEKLEQMKPKIYDVFNAQLKEGYEKREALKADNAALSDYMASLMNREQFQDGLKKNPAIKIPPKSVVTSDIENQIFGDPALVDIFKKKEDRDTFRQVLKEQLYNEKSAFHSAHPYLEGVKSIEQISELGLIDYSQFFADVKALLSVTAVSRTANEQPRLLIDEWRLSGQGGNDMYGIKKKLLADFFAGGMNAQVFAARLEQYKNEAIKSKEVDRMRFDALLAEENDDGDTTVRFNYLNVIGNKVNQTERIRKMDYALKFWQKLHAYKLEGKGDFEDNFADLLNAFVKKMHSAIADIEYASKEQKAKKSDKEKDKDKKLAWTEILKFGKLLEKMEIKVTAKKGQDPEYVIDNKSREALIGYVGDYLITDKNDKQSKSIGQQDLKMLKLMKEFFAEIAKADTADKSLSFSECMGEILLYGYGNRYFEIGGRGEETFANSDDITYYRNIIKKSNDFYMRNKEIQKVVTALDLKPEEKEQILIKVKPVIASIKDGDEAGNLSKFGVKDTYDLISRLVELYGPGTSKDKLEKSKEYGELYKARRDYIDNYGTGKDKGKFKIVRDFMMRDHDLWQKIMSLSDDEFADFMKDQDRRYGLGLSLLNSPEFRASKATNEIFIMQYWHGFQDKEDATEEVWRQLILGTQDLFLDARVGEKSVRQMMASVDKELVKRGIDPNVNGGTAFMRLQYLLNSDASAFNLMYNEKDMLNAAIRVNGQHDQNMKLFDEYINELMAKQYNKVKCADNEEDEELLKEIVERVTMGRMAEAQKAAMGSDKVIQKMAEEAEKDGEPTEAGKAYADYSLLMQILDSYTYVVAPEKFKEGLLKIFRKYGAAKRLERNSNVKYDRTVLKTKDAVRLELDIKKNQGRMLEREFLSGYSEYAEKKAALGSVGLVAYNADPKLDVKDIEAAKKFVEENISGDFGQADEVFIKGLLAEFVAASGMKKKDSLKATLKSEQLKLVNLDKALREKGGLILEEDIKKAIVFAFAQNASRSTLPLDGTHEGDIKEILEELKDREAALSVKRPVSRIAQRDYDEFTEEMDIARYTMPKAQFMELCENKRKYYELVDACVEKIGEATKDLKVQVGLFDYFRKDIYEALKAETGTEQFAASVSEQLDKLIGSKVEGRNDMKAEDIKRFTLDYLPDSSMLMQQISNTTVSAEERLFSSDKFTRADVEREIFLSGKNDLIEKYNALTVEEQKVFALSLTFPDIGMTEKEMLTSNEALRDREKEYQKETDLQEQLATYIYDKDFQPAIDYNVVMRRLMKTDRKTGLRRVSATMFEKAMEYTRFCIEKKKEMRPKDFTKLSDGYQSGFIGRSFEGRNKENEMINSYLLKGRLTKLFEEDLENMKPEEKKAAEDRLNEMGYFGVDSFREYFAKVGEADIKKDKSVSSIVERFGKYNRVQMYMLLHVLQDRTVVDYTTSQGRVSAAMLQRARYVNEEKREIIKNSLLDPDGMTKELIAELSGSMKNEMYANAAETLFGYQLRDDVDLSKREIGIPDFADDVLKRKTMIDWNMLKKAMDLVEEIEDQNRTILLCRQTVKHTTDKDAPNVEARKLGEEIADVMKQPTTNYMDYFNDFIVREANKNPQEAMPLLAAYSGLSDNEKMLLIHSLKNRDILDISKKNVFTTAIGMNENKYVNELGRDKLADYYIEHLSVPGAKNILATSQYDIRAALQSLVSTQIDDSKNDRDKKTFADMMEGTKVLNYAYVGFDNRTIGVDWRLFGNALKFVKRTEGERKLLVGESENYRAMGDLNKHGRFMYNYRFLRRNLYQSGCRLTRFIGRRLRAEIEGAIPGYGLGQRVLMACLGPEMRNKMLDSGIVKPGVSKNAVTDKLGYAGIGGATVSGAASALKLMKASAAAGMGVAGEGMVQISSALSGIYNIGNDISNIWNAGKPLDNEEELKQKSAKKLQDGKKFQTAAQQLVTKDNNLNKEWILNEVAVEATKSANYRDIMETATTCVNVLSGSSFGVQALTNVFVGGIRAAISETLNTARFLTSMWFDKKMMDRYFSDEGPLGEEIRGLRGENFRKITDDQQKRERTGSRKVLPNSKLDEAETKFIGKLSNRELFRRAYGFKDFTEEAAYVGWNIVQTLLQAASPFATDPVQFIRASLLLAAIGCKDVIGKQDNDSAQKVYTRLMGQDIR